MIQAIRISNLWKADLLPPQEDKLKKKIVKRLKNALGEHYVHYVKRSRIDYNDIYVINFKLYERKRKIEKLMNKETKIKETLFDILEDYDKYFTIIQAVEDII